MRTTGARTRASILAAARDLLAAEPAGQPTMGEIAARAGVSRLSVYHHFGSQAGLLQALVAGARPRPPAPRADSGALDLLRDRIRTTCEHWASDPALYRRLSPAALDEARADHDLAQRLATEDQLRPGCSLKEAEDVIALVTSFGAFDRLHHDGRRSAGAVAEILGRMAGAILASARTI